MTKEEQDTITKLEHVSLITILWQQNAGHRQNEFFQCDFKKVKEYQEEQREIRKNRSKEEKNQEKEEKQRIDDEYGFCMWDKHKGKSTSRASRTVFFHQSHQFFRKNWKLSS